MNHVQYICPGKHEGWYGCQFCDGGLFACTVCDSFEGATTSDCPGYRMSLYQKTCVYRGELDFRNGEWVNEQSPHCPSYYARKVEDVAV